MNEKQNIRVAIIDDHVDFREGLAHVLGATEGFTCTAKFGSVEQALAQFSPVDVLMLDINLPGKSGTEGIPLFKTLSPQTQIVMMTVFEDDDNIFAAILAGADGYILKKTPPPGVLVAIRDAAEGGTPMTPHVARRVIEHFKQHITPPIKEYDLTLREQEILACLIKGMDNQSIGEKLFISYETVRSHQKKVYEKLHVHSKAQAVAKAMKGGIA